MVSGLAARRALGVVRLVNGGLTLAAPRGLMRTIGVDPASNRAAVWALRLFGVRTVLLGLALLAPRSEEELDRTVREAVYIHASDTGAALLAGLTGDLPRRTATTATLTSLLNTVLSVMARRRP